MKQRWPNSFNIIMTMRIAVKKFFVGAIELEIHVLHIMHIMAVFLVVVELITCLQCVVAANETPAGGITKLTMSSRAATGRHNGCCDKSPGRPFV